MSATTSQWHDSVAIITGGGSGIGRALALAIARRGARIIVSDVQLDKAQHVARECGNNATAHYLDVRDSRAVSELVSSTARTHGRIDYLFNNAGIGVAGEAYEIAVELWNRILDINVRGVINGVCAAYPIMVAQKSGHIINTASLAGLGPLPLLAPYSMTKHAIVGLSTSLRLEAAKFGVKISVLCPGTIETPLLDSENPTGIPSVPWAPNIRRFLTRLAGPPYPADKLAEETVEAIERNQGIIVIPGRARLAWRLGRVSRKLLEKAFLGALAIERADRK